MNADLLERLNKARRERRAAAVWTRLASDEQGLASAADDAPDDLRDAVEARLKSGRSGTVETERGACFVNVHLPRPRLVAVGAVHISQALAPIARLAEFDVLVVDPRTAFATPERFAGTKLLAEWPEEAGLALDPFTALAALTHDPKIDDWPLQAALDARCFYVGALGSRKTHGKRLDRLRGRGVADADLERIHAPIGLDVGAATPAEIAVAVMAEVIAALRR